MNLSKIIGIVMIVIGALLILGSLSVTGLLPFLGIALIVIGILILVKTLPGGILMGVVALVVGILMLQGMIPGIPDIDRNVLRIVNIVCGVVLIVLGIGRLR